jgi:hypothetical protein
VYGPGPSSKVKATSGRFRPPQKTGRPLRASFRSAVSCAAAVATVREPPARAREPLAGAPVAGARAFVAAGFVVAEPPQPAAATASTKAIRGTRGVIRLADERTAGLTELSGFPDISLKRARFP